MALSQDHEKRLNELIAAADASRLALTSQSANLRAAFDFGGKFENAVRSNPAVWLSGASIVGWIISRLPARKKKIFVTVPDASKGAVKPSKAPTKGLILAASGLAFQLLRPALQRFVTEQITDWTDKLRRRKRK